MMRGLILLFLAFFMSFACSRNQKDNTVIPKDKMILVMSDVFVLEMYYQQKYGSPASFHVPLQKALTQLYKKHGISQEAYFKSFDYYTQNPNLFREMNAEIIQKFNEASIQK